MFLLFEKHKMTYLVVDPTARETKRGEDTKASVLLLHMAAAVAMAKAVDLMV
jgi:hypothetical protein